MKHQLPGSHPPVAGNARLRHFFITLSKSRFFTISLFIHGMIIALFGTTSLINHLAEPPDLEGTYGLIETPRTAQLPPVSIAPRLSEMRPAFEPMQTQPPAAVQQISTLHRNATEPSISPLSLFLPIQRVPAMPAVSARPSISGPAMLTRELASEMRAFTGWGKTAQGTNTGTSLRQREFEFTAFLARYRGGNWNSTVQIRDSQITSGSLPNLLYLMKELSGGRINATPAAQPLDLSSDAIFAERPPFIFFTGHRDFVLTDAEVQNLRKYIRLGGAIWGDSQLAGKHSRFDIAFRREMKRILPDLDKDFQPLPPSHPIFTSGYWKEIQSAPPGINHYREPVYAMEYLGEVAILYTSNNYGDMWQTGLNKDLKFDMRRDARGRHVAINHTLFQQRGSYIHNLDEEAVADSFKFGTNIIMHLITRWEDKLRSAPQL